MTLLIPWAVTSSVLILIVLAVRFLLKDRLSARLKYALWGVVLLRLLVPFQIELPAAAGDAFPLLASNLVPEVADMELYALRTNSRPLPEDSLAQMRENGIDVGSVIGTTAMIHQAGDLEWEGSQRCFVLSETGIDTYFFYTTLPKFLMTLWVIGALCTAWTIFNSNRYFFGRLKYYRRELEGVDTPVLIYTAANLPSPCLFGVFRPAVYLTPQAAGAPDTLRHVLAHELTHYRHRDHLWSALRCLALALHWYNPLVWLAVVLSKQDGELACDEGAVVRLGEAECIPYGRTLVDMVAARSLRAGDLLSCSTAMTGGGKSVKRRVAALVKKPETVKTALFAVIAVVTLSAVFVFAGREPAQRENGMFLDFLDRTTAIRYSPPAYSSTFYPSPIASEDLLDEAKKALSGFRIVDSEDPQPDLSPEKLIHESRIVLIFESGDMEYSLLWQNDYTYLFAGSIWRQSMDLQEEGETAQLVGVSGTCISQRGDNVITTLERLARRQQAGGITPGTTPELEKEPIKLLATFLEDVYSQLAELARSEEPDRVHPVTGS